MCTSSGRQSASTARSTSSATVRPYAERGTDGLIHRPLEGCFSALIRFLARDASQNGYECESRPKGRSLGTTLPAPSREQPPDAARLFRLAKQLLTMST